MSGEIGNNNEVKLAVFNELSAAMRHQAQAEYVYTASAVASYGGICLGVAALPSDAPVRAISIGVAVFVLILTYTIYKAIAHNCAIYKRIQESRVRVVLSLTKQELAFVPDVWTTTPNPVGVKRACAILGVATAGAVAFALTRAIAL
jgi:hypothetical protein